MTNITHLHPRDSETARRLIAEVPPPIRELKRKQLVRDLPRVLEMALEMILDDFDVDRYSDTSAAVGCRLLAACVARLKD